MKENMYLWRTTRAQLQYGDVVGEAALVHELGYSDDPAKRHAIYEALHAQDETLAGCVLGHIRERRGEDSWYGNSYATRLLRRYDEDMSLEDARLLLSHTTDLLAPLFAASDRALQGLSGQDHLDMWDFPYWFARMTTGDRLKQQDSFPNRRDALATAIQRLGHEDLYAKLTVIVAKQRYAIASCVPVSPPQEIVVIVHEPVQDDTDELWVLFHEVGHGLYAAGMGEDTAYVERVTKSPWKEAMAFLYEDIMPEPGVLVAEEDQDALDEVRALRMASRLWSVRTILRNLALDAVLYGNEQWPLDALIEKISAIQTRFFPLVKNFHPLWWANNMYIVEYPFYDVNYLYGWMIAAQIRAWWKRTHEAPILSKEFGDFLREKCYPPGNSVPWRELLRDITGEELNPQYLVEELSIAFPSKACLVP